MCTPLQRYIKGPKTSMDLTKLTLPDFLRVREACRQKKKNAGSRAGAPSRSLPTCMLPQLWHSGTATGLAVHRARFNVRRLSRDCNKVVNA